MPPEATASMPHPMVSISLLKESFMCIYSLLFRMQMREKAFCIHFDYDAILEFSHIWKKTG